MSQFKGGNGDTTVKIFFDGQNKIMIGHLDVGCSIGYHQHETNSEIILITSGVARCLYDDYQTIKKTIRHSYFQSRTSEV